MRSDAFGVQCARGIAGALLTGVFAVEAYGGTSGLIEGNAMQVLNQLAWPVDHRLAYDRHRVADHSWRARVPLYGLRISEDVEREGLDLAVHGEAVH